MTVLCLLLYYQQEQVWFLPTKEPELAQIWDDYKASWPWGSLVSLHYLSLRCPCWFSQAQGSLGDSTTDKFCGCPPLRVYVGSTTPNSWLHTNRHDFSWRVREPLGKLSLNVFPLCLSVGIRTNKKDIVGQGMGLFWPCVWLPPLSLSYLFSCGQISAMIAFPNLEVMKMSSSPFSSLNFVCNCFCFVLFNSHYQII